MKKSLLLLAGALSLGSLNAQTTEEQTTKFRDNWSIGLNGGIVTPLSHSAFFKNARATVTSLSPWASTSTSNSHRFMA